MASPAVNVARPAQESFFQLLTQHPAGFWFIFWGEFAERCSYYGMRAILATYMANKLGFGQALAGAIMPLFIAACYLLPLVGGWIADNYLGKYRTIVYFSIPYILGHVILGIENWFALFVALSLLAMGTGVTKPNISTLMGLTYDQFRPGNELLRSQAFSMFYMSINIGAAISQLYMPVIKENYSYAIAFMFPAALMVIAFVFFAAGKRFYAEEKIERKTVTREEWQVRLRTVRKVSGVFLMVVFFWAIFDQSASTWIFFGDTYQDTFELPLLGKMTAERLQSFNPMLIVLLLPFVSFFWIRLENLGIRVKATSKLMAGFFLTGLCMLIMAMAGLKAGRLTTLYVPMEATSLKQAQGDAKAKLPVSYDAAAIATTLACPASWADAATFLYSPTTGRTPYVAREGRVSLWWQALAYLLLTTAEILISVTGLEMAFVAAPKNMKSFITSLWLLTVFLANFFLNTPLGYLYPFVPPGLYFLGLSALMGLVMVVFIFVARRYNRIVEQEAIAAEAK